MGNHRSDRLGAKERLEELYGEFASSRSEKGFDYTVTGDLDNIPGEPGNSARRAILSKLLILTTEVFVKNISEIRKNIVGAPLHK